MSWYEKRLTTQSRAHPWKYCIQILRPVRRRLILVVRSQTMTMRAFVVLLLPAILAGCVSHEPLAISCTYSSIGNCGCRIFLPETTCPPQGVHFFHELHQGSPLIFSLGDGDIHATSVDPKTNYFLHGPGDAWVERYSYSGGPVEIHYQPGASTCSKLEFEECEYFDVNATVIIQTPSGRNRVAGVGQCGC